jgi:RNA polymerase sigma-70 factor (ECF subfamily)
MTQREPLSSWDSRSDEELVAALSRGSQEALGPLYSRYAAVIYARAAGALDPWTAEEIVQDVLLSVWRAAGSYDPERAPVRAWILQIARFRISNELRRTRARPATVRDGAGIELNALVGDAQDPAEAAWQAEHGEQVRLAVQALPASQREALGLAYFAGLSHAEIAQRLQVPLGTAKTRIRSGMQKLRGALAPLVAAVVITVGGLGGVLYWRLQAQQADTARKQRALLVATASDSSAFRLTPQPGVPSEAHAIYRGRPGATTAVVTLSHLPPLPAGETYQVWAQHDSKWVSLGTARVNDAGMALFIVEGDKVSRVPDALEVTVEHGHGSMSPRGPVVLTWQQGGEQAPVPNGYP